VEAWSQYVRGGIVSLHATTIIKQFLATCCGRSQGRANEALPGSRDLNDSERQTKNELGLEAVHMIIRDMNLTRKDDDAAGDGMQKSTTTQQSMQLTSRLWAFDTQAWSDVPVSTTGVLVQADEEAVVDKGNRSQPHEIAATRDSQRMCEKAYVRLTKKASQLWLAKVRAEPPSPKGAQLTYLKGIIDRCEHEAAELHGREPKREPSREFLLGPPGTRKSECIRWTIRYFNECLGWEHGVQYQCLASQHTMAALIGGTTMHGWGKVPVNATQLCKAAARKRHDLQIDDLFLRAQSIRWLLIDECSTLAAMVLGVVDTNMRRVWSRQLYAKRDDGTARAFGGVNIRFCGDFLQLPPCTCTRFVQ
jgi:hypothetical protein